MKFREINDFDFRTSESAGSKLKTNQYKKYRITKFHERIVVLVTKAIHKMSNFKV